MAVTVDSFKAAHPEFAANPTGQLTVKLAAVEARVSDDWGALRDEVVMLELADTLASAPAGMRARKVDDGKGRNVYHEKLMQLKAAHALTRRVM